MRPHSAILLTIAFVVTGCAASDGSEETASTSQPKIIGTNDLTPVVQDGANIPSKYAPLIDGFGKLSNGCSVTHIGNGVAITAGHCFNSPATRASNLPCGTYSVAWGYRQDKAPYLTSKC